MAICKECNKKIDDGYVLGCKFCEGVFCEKCAKKTHRICPNCYSDLEYIG